MAIMVGAAAPMARARPMATSFSVSLRTPRANAFCCRSSSLVSRTVGFRAIAVTVGAGLLLIGLVSARPPRPP
jgi:ABC-type uncharacterized transport system permease subunit